MKRAVLLLVLMSGCGGPSAPPPPPKPAAGSDYRLAEARNYIEFFRTADTRQWDLAKERLVRLGPPVIPVLFSAMQEQAGEVDFNCQDVLRRMGPEALTPVLEEIRKGDAGCSGAALTRRRTFRGGLIVVVGESRAAGAAAGLGRILREDSWPTARQKAAFYLGFSKDPASMPFLIEALRQDPDAEVRDWVRTALKRRAGRDLGPNADTWELWWKSASPAP